MSKFSFGVIADVQWADLDNGTNFSGTVKRCFRGALQTLRTAAKWWSEKPPTFVAQLGDLIDGRNAASGQSAAAVDAALEPLRRLPCPTLNVVGNHELYNFNRTQLAELFPAPATAAPGGTTFYYSVVPAPGFRVIVLDGYRESVILPEGASHDDARREIAATEQFQRAAATLKANNPNDFSQPGDWGRGMSGLQRRFMPYNGALGEAQLAWLRGELAAAAAARERVIVLSHTIFHPDACDGTTMAWDFPEALAAMHESGVVLAVIAGHDHPGYYVRDSAGVHHLTFASPLNLGADGHAYGIVAVHDDHLELRGPAVGDLLPPTDRSVAAGLPPARGEAGAMQVIAFPFATK